MGITNYSLFPVLLLIFFLFLNFLAAQSSSPPSIYDHLKHNGLPEGILPKGVTDFSTDPETNRFQVNLTQPCNSDSEIQFHYDLNITGPLSFGKIANLSGVFQQELFLWFPVTGIRVDDPASGLINFDVGVVNKQFSFSLFETPLDCTAVDPNDSFSSFQLPSKLVGAETAEEQNLRAIS
ncbi:uncharacterized protein LOC120161702 [Hibiscus syriacus]|uniref:uncharacterized protein LOC120161702 n=1 Tax=Hibiscus syriacus TaxID=106335 RepID=UPI001920E4B6|nr:uncharacterized protein LOC120161702 [Hibiscus syriacus]